MGLLRSWLLKGTTALVRRMSNPPPNILPGIVVTLDAQSTLYKFKKPIAEQYIEVARRNGIETEINVSELAAAFKDSFKEMSREYPNYGHGVLKTPRAWWKTVVNDAFRQVVAEKDIPDDLGEKLYDHFKSSAAYELYPDVLPFFQTIRDLKNQYSGKDDPSIFVGLMSNSDPRVTAVLRNLGLRVGSDFLYGNAAFVRSGKTGTSIGLNTLNPTSFDHLKSEIYNVYSKDNDIDFVATSYAAEAEKPNEAIFTYTKAMALNCWRSKREQGFLPASIPSDDLGAKIEVLNTLVNARSTTIAYPEPLKDSTFIHVGDDYAKDYLGAKANGWEAMHLVRGDEGESVSGAETITNLGQAAAAISLMANMNFSKKDVV